MAGGSAACESAAHQFSISAWPLLKNRAHAAFSRVADQF
jgi:hypothetical protein